ncbi:hypothetical protein E2562_011937 [Oryza meyeriana var. granulata]|uniref:Uncharacterized protein n=1 Tax=Oryza meyeriana var. granulata TaxID=110450 RepID=A0A6G1CEG4_9ORYZ|nr:hypothetical protein E2562_011937 [Oryza meyeriana var. granulata]
MAELTGGGEGGIYGEGDIYGDREGEAAVAPRRAEAPSPPLLPIRRRHYRLLADAAATAGALWSSLPKREARIRGTSRRPA